MRIPTTEQIESAIVARPLDRTQAREATAALSAARLPDEVENLGDFAAGFFLGLAASDAACLAEEADTLRAGNAQNQTESDRWSGLADENRRLKSEIDSLKAAQVKQFEDLSFQYRQLQSDLARAEGVTTNGGL